jgi:hypothetical protein
MLKTHIPTYINVIGNTIEKIEKDNFKSLEIGETFINTQNKHLLYKIDYINGSGNYSYYFDVLKPSESLTKTNPLNKVKIYI